MQHISLYFSKGILKPFSGMVCMIFIIVLLGIPHIPDRSQLYKAAKLNKIDPNHGFQQRATIQKLDNNLIIQTGLSVQSSLV